MTEQYASSRLGLPYLQAAQAQKHVTHNEALERLDILVQLAVEAFEEGTPPALPEEGQVWVVGAPASGAWAGHAGEIAAWAGGGWLFMTPQSGWHAANGADFRVFDGTSWVAPAPDTSNVPGVGINTNFDGVNRLAVVAEASLFSHEGAGHQVKINKAATGDTASLLFQTDWSGRAEMGITGSDDFAMKVSPDGTTWHEAMVLNRTNGNAILKEVSAEALTGNAVTHSDSDTTPGRLIRTGHRVFPALISAPANTGIASTAQSRALLASSDSIAAGGRSAVIAADGCEAFGTNSAAMSSSGSIASGPRSIVLAARGSEASGAVSAVIGSWSGGCEASGTASGVLFSNFVRNEDLYSVAMGHAASGGISTANRKIHLYGQSGDIKIAGGLTSGHTFSDFAEMFPNATGREIPLGMIVTEGNGAVRPAGPGDEIAGVVTATAVVTAGDTPFAWQGRYLSDEWGQPIMKATPDPDYEAQIPDPGWQPDLAGSENQQPPMIANPQPQGMINVQAENPAWNPDAPQIPRSQRPDQWTRVGLLGQVFTRIAADVTPGDRLSAVDGIGVKSMERTGLRCMTITQPFDAGKGYGVARCLVNVRI